MKNDEESRSPRREGTIAGAGRTWRIGGLALTLGLAAGTGLPAGASWCAPVVTGVSPSSLAHSARFQLSGSGFGAMQGSASIRIGGRALPATRWSDTQITAYVLGDVPLGPTSLWVTTEEGASNTLAVQVGPLAPGPEHVAWRFQMDAPYMLHRPAVRADGAVYAQDVYGFVYALARDGRLRWIVNSAGFPSGGGGEGPVALGSDGTIYLGANPLGPEVHIVALDPDGTQRWSFTDTNTQGVIAGPAVGPDGNVYVVTDYGSLGAFSLTPEGGLRWSNAGEPRIIENGQLGEEVAFGPTSPGGPVNRMYAAFDCRTTAVTGNLFAFSMGGSQALAIPVGGQDDPLGQRQSQPTVGPDGTVYISAISSTEGWRLRAFAPSSGSPKWSYGGGGTNGVSEPDAASDGTIYIARNASELHAVNPDGTTRWARPGSDILFGPIASPTGDAVLVGGRLAYGEPGFVRALGAQGDPLWTVPLPSEGGLSMVPSSRPKFSPDGSRAYVGTMLPGQPAGQEYSYLYAFDAGAAPILEADTATPAPFEFAARPNPFRDVADLELRLPRATHVRLEVIDLSGRRVASLFEGSLGAGTHTHGWDGLDRGGNPVGLGLYFVRADAGAATVTRKLVRAR